MDNFQVEIEEGKYGIAKGNLKALLEKISDASLDNYIDVSSYEVTCNPDNILAVFPLKKQQLIDEFVDRLSHRLHLRVLFFSHDDNKGDFRSVLYSMPYPEEMYFVHLESRQHGLLDNIKVVLYDSMEIMQKDILRLRNHASGEIMQMTNDVKLIRDFG